MPSKQILPIQIVTKADVLRIQRELENLNESLHQSGLRAGGEATELPKISSMTDELAKATGANLLHTEDRKKLLAVVQKINKTAPVVHISFAASPSAEFLQKIVTWFRTEINSTLLLQVGLQPSIAAGCIIRTPNKQFDFSLRQYLQQKQELLFEMIRDEK